MTNRPEKTEKEPESSWQLKLLIGIIAVGVVALILKTIGLF
jgi:hypothetical protein